jgi:hypothetical protein
LKKDYEDAAYYGDIVIRLVPPGSTNGETAPSEGNMEKNDIASDLSWVRHVVDLPNGHVQVKWGDGNMSTVRGYIWSYFLVLLQHLFLQVWYILEDK